MCKGHRRTNGRDILLKMKITYRMLPGLSPRRASTSVSCLLAEYPERGCYSSFLEDHLEHHLHVADFLHLLFRHRCRRRSRLTAARPRTWLPNCVERERTSTWTSWRISCPRRSARRDKNGAIVLNPQGSPGRICTGLARCIVLGAPSRARDRFHAAMFRCGSSSLLSRTGW